MKEVVGLKNRTDPLLNDIPTDDVKALKIIGLNIKLDSFLRSCIHDEIRAMSRS